MSTGIEGSAEKMQEMPSLEKRHGKLETQGVETRLMSELQNEPNHLPMKI
jgi:hypothetical protein